MIEGFLTRSLSRLGAGTIFTLRLPRAAPNHEEAAA